MDKMQPKLNPAALKSIEEYVNVTRKGGRARHVRVPVWFENVVQAYADEATNGEFAPALVGLAMHNAGIKIEIKQ